VNLHVLLKFLREVFHASQDLCKTIKIRDPSEDITTMPKLAFEEKIRSMYKKLSICLYMGYGPIYWQIGRDQPELGFLLLV
jgi:hypothetical protein